MKKKNFIHFSPKFYAYLKSKKKIRKSDDFSGFLYGRKLPNGTWTGLVGALATGDIDLVKLTSLKNFFIKIISSRLKYIDLIVPEYYSTFLFLGIKISF